MAGEPPDSPRLFPRLSERLAQEGLHVVLPLGRAALEAATGASLGLHERTGGWSAVIVGDGGGEFFARFLARFSAAPESDPRNPLDAYTRRRVKAVVEEIAGGDGIAFDLHFPFASERVHLPFQRLGQAAGLPPPGPLGVQVHPTFGPWWAYRALVVLAAPLASDAGLQASCAACPGPCVNDCAVHGAGAGRWERGQLLGSIVCGDACGARSRCPVGRAAHYPPAQIAFHARARDALAGAARGA